MWFVAHLKFGELRGSRVSAFLLISYFKLTELSGKTIVDIIGTSEWERELASKRSWRNPSKKLAASVVHFWGADFYLCLEFNQWSHILRNSSCGGVHQAAKLFPPCINFLVTWRTARKSGACSSSFLTLRPLPFGELPSNRSYHPTTCSWSILLQFYDSVSTDQPMVPRSEGK